jgi:coatomer protein complex subunit alpha (xenin)
VSPYVLFNLSFLQEQQKEAAKIVTAGKFSEALTAYRRLLQQTCLAVAATTEEERELHDLVALCTEYVTAMRLEVTRKTLPEGDVVRSLELLAYLTCCKLAPAHQALTLRMAMTTAFKAQNFITAAYFAKRLLDGKAKPSAELATQARKVLAVC